MIPFTRTIPIRQIYRDRKYIDGCLGLGQMGRWKVTANGNGVSFGGAISVLTLTVVMVAKLCDYTKNPWIVHLNGCIVCELHLNKFVFLFCFVLFLKRKVGASLVAQWLTIRLPMQGTRVRALVWEDHTCYGATKPASHNYWSLRALEPVLRNKRSHRNEKPKHHNKE